MYFRKYCLGKRGLDKCLKNPSSECPSTSNMANGKKHCCNLDSGTFIIWIVHSEHNLVGKSLPQFYAKN